MKFFAEIAFECFKGEYKEYIFEQARPYYELTKHIELEQRQIGFSFFHTYGNMLDRLHKGKEDFTDFIGADWTLFNPELGKINPKFINNMRILESRSSVYFANLTPMKLLNDRQGICAKHLLLEFKKLCAGAGFQNSSDETILIQFETLKHRLKDYSFYAFARYVDYSNFERNQGIKEKQGLENYEHIINKVAEYQQQANVLMNNINYITTN